MALKTISIGSLRNVIMYDDLDYPNAIETDGAIDAGSIIVGTLPVKSVLVDGDMILIRDSENSDVLSTCSVTAFKTFLSSYYDIILKGSLSLSGEASMTIVEEVI